MMILLFVVGLVLLLAGAEVLVRGASRMAVNLGISPLIVGLTVVAFATGSPELAVTIQSVRVGQSDIALGNLVGSNIFNTLFILGISALIVPLSVSGRLVRLETPLMVVASGVLYGMARDGTLGKVEGAVLLAALIGYTLFIIYETRTGMVEKSAVDLEEIPKPSKHKGGWLLDIVLIGVGLGMLVLGARWLVAGAVAFAQYLGISDEIIALTIIAAGTGLPEVATSVVAGLRGHRDLAVGNIVGSNIFNILAVGGIAAVFAPGVVEVSAQLIKFDLPIMVATAALCLPVLYTSREISRWEGLIFLGYYIAYLAFLVLMATGHSALPVFNQVMLWGVLPVTLLTFAISLGRAMRRQWVK